MSADSRSPQPSTLIVDECFARGGDEFVDLIRNVIAPKYLAALADRWKKDPRPWARGQIFAYLERPFDRPGHHPVVKHLFKHAEQARDHELMGAFLVAFDRLVRRQRKIERSYDFQARQMVEQEVLVAPRDQILAKRASPNAPWHTPLVPRNGRLFSYTTRAYLRRRVWRYFRRIGFQNPSDYPRLAAAAIGRYQDADLARGENIFDNWSLMQIAFGRSPLLKISPSRVQLADGARMDQLAAAPRFPALWKAPESCAVLLNLVMQARSRLVRVWAMQLLKESHTPALRSISVDQMLALLDHDDDEVQQFAASLLDTLDSVDNWPIDTWLRLLQTRNVGALTTLCQTMTRRVSPERLTLEQCVALACARATPVARLGLTWTQGRPVKSVADRALLARLANARCEAVGEDAAALGLGVLGLPDAYNTDLVIGFFDSLNPAVRRGVWAWLTPAVPGYADAALWSRLLETPYDDVRLQLIDELDKRLNARPESGASSKPSAALLAPSDLAPVWTAVLLGIHRGGRSKLRALRQIALAIAARPESAERLIPVLAVAIRSVRPAEARAGLSAILTAIDARPELEPLLARHIPELRFTPGATS